MAQILDDLVSLDTLRRQAWQRRDVETMYHLREQMKALVNDLPYAMGWVVISDSLGRNYYHVRIVELDGCHYFAGEFSLDHVQQLPNGDYVPVDGRDCNDG